MQAGVQRWYRGTIASGFDLSTVAQTQAVKLGTLLEGSTFTAVPKYHQFNPCIRVVVRGEPRHSPLAMSRRVICAFKTVRDWSSRGSQSGQDHREVGPAQFGDPGHGFGKIPSFRLVPETSMLCQGLVRRHDPRASSSRTNLFLSPFRAWRLKPTRFPHSLTGTIPVCPQFLPPSRVFRPSSKLRHSSGTRPSVRATVRTRKYGPGAPERAGGTTTTEQDSASLRALPRTQVPVRRSKADLLHLPAPLAPTPPLHLHPRERPDCEQRSVSPGVNKPAGSWLTLRLPVTSRSSMTGSAAWRKPALTMASLFPR